MMDKRLNVTKNKMLRTQQPHGQEQEQEQEQHRETTRNNVKQRETTIHHDSNKKGRTVTSG